MWHPGWAVSVWAGRACFVLYVPYPYGIFSSFQIKQHAETKQHKLKSQLSVKSATLDKFFGASTSGTSVGAGPSSASSMHGLDNNVTAAELALTYHTVKHNQSYNSMDCNVKLNKTIFVDSKTALNVKLGRTKMEALVNEVLGPYALETVLTDLHSPDTYFCLQTDASNKKNIKLFPLVVQYFDAENGIQNKLLDFYENPDESADGMFQAINQSLADHNLSFDRVSGLSADNTNANYGIHHSLYKNIEKVAPHLVKGNCHAHIVHNTVKHAMGWLKCDIENLILKIYSHFSVSACRREELKCFVAAVEGEWHELKRHVGTRWLSLLPCVDNILLNWAALNEYFKSLGDDCPVHLQNLLLLDDPNGEIKIKTNLNFASHILHNFNKSIKQLEGNHITVIDVYNIMATLKLTLEQRQKDSFFGYETKKLLKIIEEKSPADFNRIKSNFSMFIQKSLEYLIKWFNFDPNTNWLWKAQKFNLQDQLQLEDCENVLEVLHIQEKINIHMDNLYNELNMVNDILSKIKCSPDFMKHESTDRKWQHIFKNIENVPNLKKIVSYLLSIPATSAFTERIFSIMTLKWRDERNRASIQLIKNELMININLNFQKCEESYHSFVKNNKLIQNAKSTQKYSFKKYMFVFFITYL